MVKIYTKTGDDGYTGLAGGKRVSKTDPRIIAYGTVDELNSAIGIVISQNLDTDIHDVLENLQNELFVLGADLANPNLDESKNRINDKMIEAIEKSIDVFENELATISFFILPGGHQTSSFLNMARSIARRAETNIIQLSEKEKINKKCQIYVNRVSDLLFVLARTINKRNKITDIAWNPKTDTL